MAPGSVRTIPPWVIQRPPQAVPPQHNHAPSDTRHARGKSDSSRDDRPYDDSGGGSGGGGNDDNDGDTYNGSNHTSSKTANTGNTGRARHNTNTTTTGSTMRDTTDTDGLATAADGVKEPSAPIIQKDESAGSGIRHRLSHLFLRKEGRRWDHLRSAEPVIVPQYHVVTRPVVDGRGEEDEDSYFPDIRVSSPPAGRQQHNGGDARPSEGAPFASGSGSGSGNDNSNSNAHPHPNTQTPHARRKPLSPTSPSDQERHPWWYNPETQWRGFIESSRYPHIPNEKSEIVNDEEMARLNPDFGYNAVLRPKVGGSGNGGRHGGHGGGGLSLFHLGRTHGPAYDKDEVFYKRIWHLLLHHPLGPLACRLTVLMTSIVALVLAATIYRRERLSSLDALGQDSVWLADRHQERTQVIVAIVVDVVAIPYIGYITVDDYTGKPLGLRRPQERIRLLLTDLFFIIFKSASTALGFEAMIFFTTEDSEGLLRALGAFELIGLIAWVMTLTINIFREIERLVGK